jgi:hypothetical protein
MVTALDRFDCICLIFFNEQVSGDESWTGTAIASLEFTCVHQLMVNFTLWVTVNGQWSPPWGLLGSLCPSGCQEHGQCVAGKN